MTTLARYATPASPLNYPALVEVELARALGVQPGTAHQLMHGRESVFTRATLIAQVLVGRGQRARAERLSEGLLRTLASAPAPAFSTDLVVREAEAAARVEAARAAFQAHDDHERLAAFERAIRAHEQIERDLDGAAVERLEART